MLAMRPIARGTRCAGARSKDATIFCFEGLNRLFLLGMDTCNATDPLWALIVGGLPIEKTA
jgi:hypothetical protein